MINLKPYDMKVRSCSEKYQAKMFQIIDISMQRSMKGALNQRHHNILTASVRRRSQFALDGVISSCQIELSLI